MTPNIASKKEIGDFFIMLLLGALVPFLTTIFFCMSAQSAEVTQACGKVDSPQAVIDCALSNHPEARRASLSNLQAENLESAAAQRPNPELNGNFGYGNLLGDHILNTEANLAFVVEVGGKRGARIDKALAEKSSVAASSLRSREEVLLETIRALYRLRQIEIEFHTLDEALETFVRIQKQFRSRPRRTPEQEVSYSVFGFAEGDYRLRRAALETEFALRKRTIELAIGQPFDPSAQVLPNKRSSWPELSQAAKVNEFKGSAMNSARAGFKLAEAELSLAQSASWPNLKVGPSFQNQTQGALTFQTYGFNMAFEIPLFQANGGGRAYARAGLDLAEQGLSLREREITNRRDILVQKYSNSVKVLSTSLTRAEIEKKHQSTDSLFARGIIPSSLVIEAHRQIVDFTKAQNEQELSALEALWEIYVLEGRAFEEKL